MAENCSVEKFKIVLGVNRGRDVESSIYNGKLTDALYYQTVVWSGGNQPPIRYVQKC